MWDAAIERLRQMLGTWEFRWSDLKWRELYPSQGTYYAKVRHPCGTLEVWTHDNHATYVVFTRSPIGAVERRLANYVDALSANCICIEFFEELRTHGGG